MNKKTLKKLMGVYSHCKDVLSTDVNSTHYVKNNLHMLMNDCQLKINALSNKK